jgi:hypothetical protein
MRVVVEKVWLSKLQQSQSRIQAAQVYQAESSSAPDFQSKVLLGHRWSLQQRGFTVLTYRYRGSVPLSLDFDQEEECEFDGSKRPGENGACMVCKQETFIWEIILKRR